MTLNLKDPSWLQPLKCAKPSTNVLNLAQKSNQLSRISALQLWPGTVTAQPESLPEFVGCCEMKVHPPFLTALQPPFEILNLLEP